MRHRFRLLLCALAILVGSPLLPWSASPAASAASLTADRISALVNSERIANGAPALQRNPLLDQAAIRKAQDMTAQNYFAHQSPEGKKSWDFLSSVGYAYAAAGENLAVDFVDAQIAVQAWMQSAGHRTNILSRAYRETGVAVIEGRLDGRATIFIVQLFAAPSVRATQPKPQSEPSPPPTPVQDTTPPKPPTPPTPAVDNHQEEGVEPSSPVTVLRSYTLPDFLYPERGFSLFVELSEPVGYSSVLVFHRDVPLHEISENLLHAQVRLSRYSIHLFGPLLTTMDQNGLVKNHGVQTQD